MPIECNNLVPAEIATGVLFGRDYSVDVLPRSDHVGAVAALEQSLVRALLHPPCFVSFSGGRDSSALLAIATRAARREGLPEPVPVTARYPSLSQTHEESWQQLVVQHLGLTEWVQQRFTDAADLIGPIACRLMQQHGLQYPHNLHLQAPLIQEARGGSFVTGLGGDEALMPRSRALAVITGNVRPVPRDVLRIAAAVAPRRVRRAVLARRPMLSFPWLHRDANRALGLAWLDDILRLPLRWDARLREWWRARYVHLTIRGTARIALEMDVEVSHPFTDPVFISAFAREGGVRGFSSRTAVMNALFGELLPQDVTRRATKASFNSVLWNRHTRTFVNELSGNDLDAALRALRLEPIVDRSLLAGHWSTPSPMANSFLLLQACWLALRS